MGTEDGTPEPLLACPGACRHELPLPAGHERGAHSHPTAGATFEGWQGACAGTAPTCSVTTSGNEAVTAVFSDTVVTTPPVLPLGSESRAGEPWAGEAQPPVAGGPNGEAREGQTPSAPRLPVRLVSSATTSRPRWHAYRRGRAGSAWASSRAHPQDKR
jgi:hypothetical protein